MKSSVLKMTKTAVATIMSKTTVGMKVVNIKRQGRKEKRNAPFHLKLAEGVSYNLPPVLS